uniref:Uncharacterized protein n=1 Tax=Solanum tuberosum TaxID=4113 RepID=M0ZS13_SOLTU
MVQCLKQSYCTLHMRISDSSVLEKRKLQDLLGIASFEQHKVMKHKTLVTAVVEKCRQGRRCTISVTDKNVVYLLAL